MQEELGHQFGSDSVFWISFEDLVHKYQHFDRTRLFRDPDWRCCQRWIAVEVPWKSNYHEKFHIKLTKESPLVLVLSQLDDRYFKGLDGQYSFRLHFRLHDQDRPEAEDYVVRSHGNYLMERSVSIDLPAMPPGNYSVWINVTGIRHTGYPSIEEVVKRETKKRTENEKLAQVGSAYDLAHSKAAAHLEAVRKVRKTCDQKKSSEARQAERHRLWEKRRLNREVTKQQARKNNVKVEAKLKLLKQQEEEAAEKKRQEEENKPKDKAIQTESDANEDGDESKSADTDKSSDSKTTDQEKAAEEAEAADKKDSDAKDDDESAESTPVPTPAETPRLEKTEEEAHAGKSDTGDKGDEKADDKKADDPAVEIASSASSDTTGSPKDTPKSEDSTPADSKDEKVPVPPVDASSVSGGPPPPPSSTSGSEEPKKSKKSKKATVASPKAAASTSASTTPTASSISLSKPAKKPPVYYATSEGESSASPIEDWEELYSSDDMTRKPRMGGPPAAATAVVSKYADETEDENGPDPWNAICVVGIRVYSKDEDLELRVVMEGGELEEGGMGEKGGVDLDNAQANAGGARRKSRIEDTAYEGDSEVERRRRRKREGKQSGDDTEKEDDGMATYPTIVQKGEGESEYESAVETKDEKE